MVTSRFGEARATRKEEFPTEWALWGEDPQSQQTRETDRADARPEKRGPRRISSRHGVSLRPAAGRHE